MCVSLCVRVLLCTFRCVRECVCVSVCAASSTSKLAVRFLCAQSKHTHIKQLPCCNVNNVANERDMNRPSASACCFSIIIHI